MTYYPCDRCHDCMAPGEGYFTDIGWLCPECYHEAVRAHEITRDGLGVHPDDSPDFLPDEAFDEARLP